MKSLSLEAAAREDGDQEALLVGSRALSYRELEQRVARAKSWLRRQGLGPEGSEPVGLVMRAELAVVELFWALFALGRPILLLHPRHKAEAHQALLRRTGAALLDAASWAAASGAFSAQPLPSASAPPDIEAPRVIVPTSGTTGRPKLSVLSERALMASAHANWQNLSVEKNERWLVCLPLAHVGGLSILTRSLYARRSAVLFDGERGVLERAGELGRVLERERVTLVSLVPTLLDRLLEQHLSPERVLRAVLLGGAAAGAKLLERAAAARVPTLPSYGLTEAASQVATRLYAKRYEPVPVVAGLTPCGPPLSGVEVRVSSNSLIEVRGPTLQSGYWDDPSPLAGDGFLATGDRGCWSPSGELVVQGRSDDLIVTGGENVDPLAVEATLLRMPEVRAACVFGVDDQHWGQLVAVALTFAEEPLALAKLAHFCAENLAPHERPRLYAALPDLLATASGKLDRAATARAAAAHLVALYAPSPR
ncbi:MAG TPA: class I adenylate-forming enzyme family protein [Polyangiaceae bacterium]|nr:class I adenylate-forming enzyme family protein [Polyangiaceae bacterium]